MPSTYNPNIAFAIKTEAPSEASSVAESNKRLAITPSREDASVLMGKVTLRYLTDHLRNIKRAAERADVRVKPLQRADDTVRIGTFAIDSAWYSGGTGNAAILEQTLLKYGERDESADLLVRDESGDIEGFSAKALSEISRKIHEGELVIDGLGKGRLSTLDNYLERNPVENTEAVESE